MRGTRSQKILLVPLIQTGYVYIMTRIMYQQLGFYFAVCRSATKIGMYEETKSKKSLSDMKIVGQIVE